MKAAQPERPRCFSLVSPLDFIQQMLYSKDTRNKRGGAQHGNDHHINSRVLQTYEQGDRDIAGAKLKTLLKVCVALECRLEDIVTDDETLALIAAYNRR